MRIKLIIMTLAISSASHLALADDNLNNILGSAIGGAAGAAIGHNVGGRDGAIVGGALGAATGALITRPKVQVVEKPVYVREQRWHGKKYYKKRHPRGHAYGHDRHDD